MSNRILLDAYNGLQEYQHFDAMRPNDVIIETVQDCTAIVEAVKAERDLPTGKDWRKVAMIPMCFFDKAAKEGWLHDDAKWHRFLNDPDNKAFRVWGGRMGKSKQI